MHGARGRNTFSGASGIALILVLAISWFSIAPWAAQASYQQQSVVAIQNNGCFLVSGLAAQMEYVAILNGSQVSIYDNQVGINYTNITVNGQTQNLSQQMAINVNRTSVIIKLISISQKSGGSATLQVCYYPTPARQQPTQYKSFSNTTVIPPQSKPPSLAGAQPPKQVITLFPGLLITGIGGFLLGAIIVYTIMRGRRGDGDDDTGENEFVSTPANAGKGDERSSAPLTIPLNPKSPIEPKKPVDVEEPKNPQVKSPPLPADEEETPIEKEVREAPVEEDLKPGPAKTQPHVQPQQRERPKDKPQPPQAKGKDKDKKKKQRQSKISPG